MKKDTQEAAFRQRVLEYQRKGHSVTDTANRYTGCSNKFWYSASVLAIFFS